MNPKLLDRYADWSLPRYTSYPTAPHFGPQVAAADYRRWLAELADDEPLSLYLHVPFCRSMCWYCGCHTTVTARDEPIARYLASLAAEVELVARALGGRRQVRHVHFGGGTPTLMKPGQFLELMGLLRSTFDLEPSSEVAIEIDPRTLEPPMVKALAAAGTTRASLGVQSFDPAVQLAINRVQSLAESAAAESALRAVGIGAINVDLIYGLPRQSVGSCVETVRKVEHLAPDRIAVFGYAHVPQFKLHQRKIDPAALPGASERNDQAEAIAAALVEAGYVRIGLDHFALPGDPLAAALSNGTLRRNFQGYTTDECETLIGLGASSIGRLPQGHVQNATLISDYQRRIAAGSPATARGRAFAPQDRLRAAVIERIMCDFRVDIDSVCRRFGALPLELSNVGQALDRLIADGVATRDGNVIAMTEVARPLVRVLAAVFDEYLGQSPVRYSRAV